eukprot:TRINITY_DN7269_c0_g1_i2.p1 TRINITY_DN7269_c0_g1~~TRINITY_DN7269_c0_g1_i2.p1  ORF type:complete len:128 (+),score=22.27 TRINITY_DN7269_c0_g1_i2:73-456(+)
MCIRDRNKVTGKLLGQVFGELSFAFAYGSGAFPQTGYNYSIKKPLLDLMLIPNNIEDFHTQNLARNGDHYSKLARLLGKSAICKVQRLTTGVYFNTDIKLPDGTVYEGVRCRNANTGWWIKVCWKVS